MSRKLIYNSVICSFNCHTFSDEDSSSTVSVIKRQALSLLSCAGHALRGSTISGGTSESDQDNSSGFSFGSQIISLPLELACPKDPKAPADDVVKLARLAIGSALRAMSAKHFVQGVLVVLQSGVSVSQHISAALIARVFTFEYRFRMERWTFWANSCPMLLARLAVV